MRNLHNPRAKGKQICSNFRTCWGTSRKTVELTDAISLPHPLPSINIEPCARGGAALTPLASTQDSGQILLERHPCPAAGCSAAPTYSAQPCTSPTVAGYVQMPTLHSWHITPNSAGGSEKRGRAGSHCCVLHPASSWDPGTQPPAKAALQGIQHRTRGPTQILLTLLPQNI